MRIYLRRYIIVRIPERVLADGYSYNAEIYDTAKLSVACQPDSGILFDDALATESSLTVSKYTSARRMFTNEEDSKRVWVE